MPEPQTLRLSQLPGHLPSDCVPLDCDVSSCPKFVEDVLRSPSPEAFTNDAIWRDWMVFSDRTRTRYGSEVIAGVWSVLTNGTQPHNFQASPAQVVKVIASSSWVDVGFTFEATHVGFPVNCSGRASLIPDGSSWKIWCFSTVLEQFDGQKNPDVWIEDDVFKGKIAGGDHESVNHTDANGSSTENGATHEYYEAVIVGGGQSGMSTAVRLAALGIPYLMVEKTDEIGSSWSRRYDAMKLHTIKDQNRLPFDKTYEDDDPDYMSGKDVGRSFAKYAHKYGLNYMLSSQVSSCKRNHETGEWELKIKTKGSVEKDIRCKHLILSLGYLSAKPKMPNIPGKERFSGQVMHATEWQNPKGFEGKRGIVIGSATNAFDVSVDMVDGGLSSVNMIQRDRTVVIPVEHTCRFEKMVYNGKIPMNVIDRMGARPSKIGGTLVDEHIRASMEGDKEKYDAVERAGYKVDRSGYLYENITSTGGGYYIDVGGCDMIISGDIKVKSGVPISHFTSNGLAFVDGTEIPADVVVCATGYDSDVSEAVANVVGPEVTAKLGPWWGINVEGELRGSLVQEYPGLWRMGGPFPMVRFFSRFIALRIQAEMMIRDKGKKKSV